MKFFIIALYSLCYRRLLFGIQIIMELLVSLGIMRRPPWICCRSTPSTHGPRVEQVAGQEKNFVLVITRRGGLHESGNPIIPTLENLKLFYVLDTWIPI